MRIVLIRGWFRLGWRCGQRVSLDAGKAIDRNLRGVSEELAGPVLPLGEQKKLWSLVDELSRTASRQECRMRYNIEEKWDIGFHAADAILLERPLHPQGRIFEPAHRLTP